jgi:voltage-gated potassium channel
MSRPLYIVCGAGETGMALASELQRQGARIVLVDNDEEVLSKVSEPLEDVSTAKGDACDDKVLVSAGITEAQGLFACLAEDRDNAFLCLSARRLCPDLNIVARIKDTETEPKMKLVGVDSVINMSWVEGMRLASVMLRPDVVTLIDQMLFNPECDHSYCSILVKEGSSAVGKSVSKLDITGNTGVVLIAIRHASGKMLYNPGPREHLRAGDSLITFATSDETKAITALLE